MHHRLTRGRRSFWFVSMWIYQHKCCRSSGRSFVCMYNIKKCSGITFEEEEEQGTATFIIIMKRMCRIFVPNSFDILYRLNISSVWYTCTLHSFVARKLMPSFYLAVLALSNKLAMEFIVIHIRKVELSKHFCIKSHKFTIQKMFLKA